MKNFEKKFGEIYLKFKMYEFIFSAIALVFFVVIFLLSRCGGNRGSSQNSSSGNTYTPYRGSLYGALVEEPEYADFFSGYIVFSDKEGLYLANDEGEIKTRLYNKQVHDFSANKGWVYYSNHSDNKIYATRLAKTETMEIADTYGYDFKFSDEYLYYLHKDGIDRVSLYDMERKAMIEDGEIQGFSISDEWLIYLKSDGTIYRLNLIENWTEIDTVENPDYNFSPQYRLIDLNGIGSPAILIE